METEVFRCQRGFVTTTLAAVVLVVAIAGASSVFLWGVVTSKVQGVDRNQGTPNFNASKSYTVSTDGWKSYSDPILGYGLKYPETWINKGSHQTEWSDWHDFSSVDVEVPIAGLGSGIWLKISLVKKINQEGFWNTDASASYFDYIRRAKVGEVGSADPRYLITKTADLSVSGYPAVKRIVETAPGAQTEYIYVVEYAINRDGRLYRIEAITSNESGWRENEKAVDAIIGAFSFR